MKKFLIAIVVLTAQVQDILSDVANLNVGASSVINDAKSEILSITVDNNETLPGGKRESIIMTSSIPLLGPQSNKSDNKKPDILSVDITTKSANEFQTAESATKKLYESPQNMTLNINKENSKSEQPQVENGTSSPSINKDYTSLGANDKSFILDNQSSVLLINKKTDILPVDITTKSANEVQTAESATKKLYESPQNITLNINKEYSKSELPQVKNETSSSSINKDYTNLGADDKSFGLDNQNSVSLINNSDKQLRENTFQAIRPLQNIDNTTLVESHEKQFEGKSDFREISNISATSGNSFNSDLNDFEVKMDPVKEKLSPNIKNQAIDNNFRNLSSLETDLSISVTPEILRPEISLVSNLPGKNKTQNQLENKDISGVQKEKKKILSLDKLVAINNYKPKTVLYNPTIILKDQEPSLVESDFVVDGTLSKGIIFNSMNQDVKQQDALQDTKATDSSQESNPNYMVQFNKIHAALGKDPNSVFNEFTNLIFNYVKNRMTLDKDDVAKKLKKLKSLKPPDEGPHWKEEKPHQKVVVKDMVKELRRMVLRRDISLVNYNWLSSGVNIQVGIQKIIKLCNSTSLSELDWKLMSFIEKLFEVMRDRVAIGQRMELLDLPCTFFIEVLKRIRPLHKAMDLISSENSVDREGMFEYLRTSYLMVSSDVPLQTILLHSATNRVLEQIDSKFQDARVSFKLKPILEKKKVNMNGQMVDIFSAFSDLMEDLLLVYSLLYELNRNTE